MATGAIAHALRPRRFHADNLQPANSYLETARSTVQVMSYAAIDVCEKSE